jgi:hypothetical protein
MNARPYITRSAPGAATARILVALAVVLVPITCGAQQADQAGPRLSGFLGGGRAEGDGALTAGFSVGYRFAPRAEVEVDVAYLSHIDFGELQLPLALDLLQLLLPTRIHVTARTVTLLANYVAHLGSNDRLRPYVVGGGGVAVVSEALRFTSDEGIFSALPVRIELPSFPPALNGGGGVDLIVGQGFALGAEVRYLRLFLEDREDTGIVRVVGRATYRF